MELVNKGGITVKLFSMKEGLKQIEHVDLVRVKSKDCNLLIMYDHLPILGEIQGSIEVVDQEHQEQFDELHGYFMFMNNVFEMIMKEG